MAKFGARTCVRAPWGNRMYYQYGNHLSCCKVDDRLIFMDIDNDRYFKLQGEAEIAFRRTLEDDAKPPEDWICLPITDIRNKLATAKSWTRVETPEPKLSIIETPLSQRIKRNRASDYFEALKSMIFVRRLLQTRTLKDIIESEFLQDNVILNTTRSSRSTQNELIFASAQSFYRVRPYIPIESGCFIDSLSLAHFLARRRLPVSLVFGVTLRPFSAHCWAQAGEIVLNETLSNVNMHTPIRVV